MKTKHLISHFKLNRHLIFIIDAIGATLSAFLMAVVLPKFEQAIGIPSETLYFLALIAAFLVLYDLYSYQIKNNGVLLKGIATLNLIYCLISTGLMIHHFDSITVLGFTYILSEIIILLILAYLEFKSGKTITKK